MPRFIFNLHADGWIDHEESVELPDLATARVIALEVARELIRSRNLPKEVAYSAVVEIWSCGGQELSRIAFGEAFDRNADLAGNPWQSHCHWHL